MVDDPNKDEDFLAPTALPVGDEGAEALFQPDELDIYVNKITLEAYIFHGKPVDYHAIDHLEYDSKNYRVDVVMKDGSRVDLGVKIQWLIRAHLQKAREIAIIQTYKGDTVDGFTFPFHVKGV